MYVALLCTLATHAVYTLTTRHRDAVTDRQTDRHKSRPAGQRSQTDRAPHTRIHQSDYDTADWQGTGEFPQCTRPRLPHTFTSQRHYIYFS